MTYNVYYHYTVNSVKYTKEYKRIKIERNKKKFIEIKYFDITY